MSQNYWSVTIHKDGNHVVLYQRSAKQQLFSVLEDVFFGIDEKLNHVLCGGNIPESWWKINIGKRDYDEEYDILDSSLGARLYNVQNAVIAWLLNNSEGTEVAKLPIDQALTDELWPEMSFLGRDDEEDE